MTQEEKVKRYDEALHKAKNYYSTTDSSSDIKLIGLIFPELKESDDEKIRKALVEMVHDTTGDSLWIDYNVHKEDALAWLEKQGEQKSIDDLTQQEAMDIAVAKCFEQDEQNPDDKVEPKFKVGDYIKPIDKCLGSSRIIEEVYDGWYVTDKGTLYFEFEDNWELVEESVSRTPADIEAAMQDVEEKSRAFTEAHNGEDADTILAEIRGEKPVSDDLEAFIKKRVKNIPIVLRSGFHELCRQLIRDGAKWQKENLWKPADGDDLPEIDREVVVLIKYNAQRNIHDKEYSTYRVEFGHRPNPDGWDGRNIATDEVTHYTPKLYDKGGWNVPDIAYWLDVELPKE